MMSLEGFLEISVIVIAGRALFPTKQSPSRYWGLLRPIRLAMTGANKLWNPVSYS
jgi:hypothetical protein